MKKDDEHEFTLGIALPGALASDLRGRQSVRATFRLTEGCIDAISIVATHLGIKQKSLFDHLAEDAELLRSIAGKIQNVRLSKQGRIQKTYVVSRKALTSLEEVSKNYNTPRDALVEYSVQRLLPVIAKERKKHENRKKILADIEKHFKDCENILKKSEGLLGVDDPVYIKLQTVRSAYENAYDFIMSYIKKGRIIEDFQLYRTSDK